MNSNKKYAYRGILILFCIILYQTSLQAQVTTQVFHQEKLLIRLNHIGNLYKKNLVFDTKQVASIEVPALNITDFTIEQTLNATLQTTGLSYKKTAEQSYLIEKKAEKTSQHPSKSVTTLKGRIVESETSEPIPGAAVRLSDKQYAVSDFNGYYSFPKVPTGKYTLEVSYVGFKPEKTEITVKQGENTYDIKLSASATLLSEVQVLGVRRTRSSVPHTTEKLMVAELKGLNVLASGISSEQISKSADRNAAQAVQRVAGVTIVDDKFVIIRGLNPRYNLTYLNDNVAPSTEANSRSFALDLIPSRVIDRIVVQKTASPDVQADATGGVVKVYTKDALTVRHFDIDFQLGYREGTSFNRNFLTYNGGKWDFLGFDDGTRALPSVLPPYGSLQKADLKPSEYAKAMNPTLDYGKKTALPNMQLTANYYNAFTVFGKELSLLTSFSYKNDNQKTSVYKQEGNSRVSAGSTDRTGTTENNSNTVQLNLLQNFTYSLNENNKLFFKNFLLQQGIDVTSVQTSHETAVTSGLEYRTVNRDISLSYNQRFLYSGNLGGNHFFDKKRHRLQWNAGYSYSRQYIPDQRIVRMEGLVPSEAFGDAETQYWARGYTQSDADVPNDVAKETGIITRLWSKNSDGIYNGSLDYTFKPLQWLSFQAGTLHQWKKREYYRRVYTVHEGNINPLQYNPITSGYVDINLTRFRLQDLPNVWSESYLNDDLTGLQVFDRTSPADMYVGTEQNNSGYLMMGLTPFKWVEIAGGLRYEYNRQKIGSALDGQISTPILSDHSMSNWLPSVNLSIRPNERWVLRAAFGKTVNRTEFREVSPFSEIDYANNTSVSGNPNLVGATANNYDLRLEYYPNSNGDLLSVGAFYKKITDPIERINNSSRVISYFTTISYNNAESATLKGLEIELRKSLNFIPLGFFRDLSVTSNASFISSNIVPNQELVKNDNAKERPLQGQAPLLINGGIYYENPGWGSKVGVIYNYVGENIYAAGRGYKANEFVGGAEFRGGLIELPRQLLDFSYTQRIGKGIQMKFAVQNLLDSKNEMAEDNNFTDKYEKYHAQPTEMEDGRMDYGDNIASRFKPGRYFSLSILYSF